MKKILSILVACCLLAAGAASADGPSVSASKVWIRTAPVGVQTLSGYMTLENLTDKPLQILGITSPDFGSVMISPASSPGKLHSTLLMKTFDLPPHKVVVFQQDAVHLQLMQPKKRLYDGDMVTLIFNFSDGSTLDLLAPVRRERPAL
ncbi:MAG TPA: copper chaperone PCu(A)C [Gammaproteobacteria bacterium]|jgi:copper(I)-binding protein|nr:copper chaperone PCu(A)C [Gammaproteobacteria bacterium]